MSKARHITEARRFTDLPNIGPAMAGDFVQLGLKQPQDLRGADPLRLYRKLCKLTGQRQDPCVLDTFIAAVDFANGAAAKPWWAYTAERKRLHPDL
ncbi:helix-hairpin-helix domain-containing protein [Nevskia ramosa]|uniref:helix-hairpin-helix domain-containing protein n=1 Tax=Nevskia ramosa TaxID=64002 RepID=UPI0003B69627|nr:helix-hairpin-helix domain-containing protein [Nevskia ramosa]